MHADADKQGLVQGMITGMRGLCNGLGPAMFGLVFSLFHVDLSEKSADTNSVEEDANNTVMEVPQSFLMVAQIVPGPPFVFGALLVILALMVAAFIPENMGNERGSNQGSRAFDHHSDHSTASKKHHNHEITKKSDDDFDDYEGEEEDGEFRIPLMDSAKGGVL